jgi:enoyl-CoA hydratase/carnithine racemase
MSRLEEYQGRFRNVQMTRSGGVLELKLHSDGAPLQWGAMSGSVHEQLGEAFFAVAHDADTRVVILTGAGDAFCTDMNLDELPTTDSREWSRLMREGRSLVMQLLDIEVPVIAAVNGPAHVHAQLPVLADIVLAAETAEFADLAHFVHGVVPGDSAQVVWPALLGANRGRYFLLTGQRLSAREALALGVVSEVLPADRLMARARELAGQLAQKPPITLRNTRLAFTHPWKRRMLEELGPGLALEGLSILAAAERSS